MSTISSTSYDYSALKTTVSGPWWEKHDTDRKAGFQVFLPGAGTAQSTCCGEFPDIRDWILWGKATGHKIAMFTPFGPIGYGNSPFSSRSSFALEPMFGSPRAFKGVRLDEFGSSIQDLQKAFPTGTGKIDYRFIPEKLKLFREMFEAFKREHGEPREFTNYLQRKQYWIEDFALYEAIKQKEELRSWKDWPKGLREREPKSLSSFRRRCADDITFHAWLQWQTSMQMQSIKKFAEDNDFLIMGNIPFLAAEDSADVWALRQRGYFKEDLAAGAPIDQYCPKGQRWGNPPINWEAVEGDGFEYFDQKLQEAANNFDLYILDHVFGLARLYSIPVKEPMENQGLNGFFDPKDPIGDQALWDAQLKRLLTKMIKSTHKLQPVAENLGVGPNNCDKILEELGILGFKVPRWTKDWANNPSRFIPSTQYGKFTAVMPGIHDAPFPATWYETVAGTVDGELFERMCNASSIPFNKVKDVLFDIGRSSNGRLRWRENVDLSTLVQILGQGRKGTAFPAEPFIGLHKGTFGEQTTYWRHIGMKGKPTENATPALIRKVAEDSLNADSIFSLTPLDVLLGMKNPEVFTSGPRPYINKPGTTYDNWEHGLPKEFAPDVILHEGINNEEILEMNIKAGRANRD